MEGQCFWCGTDLDVSARNCKFSASSVATARAGITGKDAYCAVAERMFSEDMMNPSFNTVSQYAHVGWGYIFVTAPAMMFHVKWWILVVGVIVLSGAKEYWDSHGLETPDVAGNGWEDWGFWCVGALLALAVLVFSGQVRLKGGL